MKFVTSTTFVFQSAMKKATARVVAHFDGLRRNREFAKMRRELAKGVSF